MLFFLKDISFYESKELCFQYAVNLIGWNIQNDIFKKGNYSQALDFSDKC